MALRAKGKNEQADMVKNILPAGVECIFVRQPEQLGLGHAVLCAERAVGNDPFAVLLADDFLTYEGSGVTADLARAFATSGKTQLSVMEVNGPDISKYGVVVPDGAPRSVAGLVEKPDADKAPSNLASIGRYVLTPDIFDILRNQPAGAGGEIQLADAIKPGDEVRILPSGKTSHVDRIVTYDGDLNSATVGQSITLTLKDEVDCSRGQVITAASAPLEVADQFETTLIWMDEEALIPGRSYYLKIGAQTVSATVAEPKYQINVNTMEHAAAKTLELNAIGVANVTTDRDIPFAPYAENRTLGGFILIDKMTNATVGAGLINFALRRAQNIHWQATNITRDHHANLKNQKPAVL